MSAFLPAACVLSYRFSLFHACLTCTDPTALFLHPMLYLRKNRSRVCPPTPTTASAV